jgi:hypothetical protein
MLVVTVMMETDYINDIDEEDYKKEAKIMIIIT